MRGVEVFDLRVDEVAGEMGYDRREAAIRYHRDFLDFPVVQPDEIQVRDLPTAIHGAPAEMLTVTHTSNGIVPMAELERQTIMNALTKVNGDKMLAARLLGIGKTTLYRKLKEYEQVHL